LIKRLPIYVTLHVPRQKAGSNQLKTQFSPLGLAPPLPLLALTRSLAIFAIGSIFVKITALLTLILVVFLALPFKGRADSVPTMEQLASQQLSQGLYAALLAEHYATAHKTFDAKALADTAYFSTILNEWSQRLESKKYFSTQQIFLEFQKSRGYIGKNYETWRLLRGMDPKSPLFINLGEARNSFLSFVIYSESKYPSLKTRILKTIDQVNLLLITNSRAFDLAKLILIPFLESNDNEIREKTKATLTAIGFTNFVSGVMLARDLVFFGRGSPGVTPARIAAVGRPLTRAAGAVGTRVKYMIDNPAAAWLSVGNTASGAIHSLMPAYLLWRHNKNQAPKAADPLPPNEDDVEISIAKLWQGVAVFFPEIFSAKRNDFATSFSLKSLGPFVQEVRAAIDQQSTTFDYLYAFLQSEKHLKFDGRRADDLLAMDFLANETKKLQAHIASKYGQRTLTNTDIEEIRKYLIEGPLKRYKRDYPNMIGTLLDWGGNCVAQTMLIAGLLNPYRDRLPNQGKLLIALFSDHVEPVIVQGDTMSFLVTGEKTPSDAAQLFRPELLLNVLLKNFVEAKALVQADESFENTFQNSNNDRGQPSGQTGNINLLPKVSITDYLSNLFKKTKRFGALEKFDAGLIKPRQGRRSSMGDGAGVPETATMRFAPLHENQSKDIYWAERGSASSDFFSQLNEDTSTNGNTSKGPIYKLRFTPDSGRPFSFSMGMESSESDGPIYVVLVHSKGTYLDLLKKTTEKNFTFGDMAELLVKQYLSDADRFTKTIEYQRNVVAPGLDLTAYGRLSAAEMKSWNRYNAVFSSELSFLQDQIKYFLKADSNSRNSDFNIDEIIGEMSFVAGIIRQKVTADKAMIYRNISENPDKFIAGYSRMSIDQRAEMMTQTFSCYHYLECPGYLSSLESMAYKQVQLYLGRLSPNKIQIPKYELPKGVIYLLDIKKWDPKVPQLPQTSGDNGKADSLKTPNQNKEASVKVAAKKSAEANSDLDVLVLSPEILMELTIAFRGYGLQLWNKAVVDYVAVTRFFGIFKDKELPYTVLKVALLTELPEVTGKPYFQPLKSVLSGFKLP
jgi:hypothetical protein